MTRSAEPTLANIDLSTPDAFADGPPHDVWARMRAEAPVHWNPMKDEPGFWSVTRNDDIVKVARDWETFSSGRRGGNFLRNDSVVPFEISQNAVFHMDPPRQTQHRAIVQSVFTPRAIAEREPEIRRLATELIDSVIERGECEFAEEVAMQVPLKVIADMLGVPASDQPRLVAWSNNLSGFDDETLRKHPEDGLKAFWEMGEYLVALVEERKARPRDDLISRLIQAEVDGEKLNDLELTAFFALLLSAGNETTRYTLSGGMLALMEHPDQRQRLLDDPSLIPQAVEEIMRWHSVALHARRTATRTTEMHGVTIEEGDKVVMWWPSANRDEQALQDAGTFDVGRTGFNNLTLGRGVHFCLGNQLARLQLSVIFTELLTRIPDMELAGPYTRLRSNLLDGFVAMPVSFTPRARAES